MSRPSSLNVPPFYTDVQNTFIDSGEPDKVASFFLYFFFFFFFFFLTALSPSLQYKQFIVIMKEFKLQKLSTAEVGKAS
jgi:hypothetical protein